MKTAARELLTERLELRWLTEDDAGLMLAIWTDPGFMQHVGDRGVRTVEQAREAMGAALALYESYGYGAYRVALRGGGPAIGICGLFRRPVFDRPDIGYALLPEGRGLGYALEAARAVMREARDGVGLDRVLAIVSPGHRRSIALLEKLGMHAEGTVRLPDEDDDLLLYARDFGDGAEGAGRPGQ